MVIPVMAAIQLRRGFLQTLFWAEAFSIFSVLTGIFVSFYLDLAPGGTIVLIAFALFFLAYFRRRD
jgi:zinc transport system permease protein